MGTVASPGGSRVALAFRATSFAVLLMGAASVVTAAGLHPLGAVVALTSPLLAFMRTSRLRVPTLVWNLVGLAAIALSVAAWRLWYVHPISVLAHLTVFFQVYRVLARQGLRGWQLCYLIAFSQLALASILTIDFSFLLICVVFCFTTAWALLLLRVRMAYEQTAAQQGASQGSATPPDADRLLTAPYLGYVTVMNLVLVAGATVLFLLMPRLHFGLANRYATAVHVSGFSEEVRLGEVGSILQRNDPVMRVGLRARDGRPLNTPLYYHGLALDRFDGHRWKLSDATVVHLINRAYGERDRPMPAGADITQEYSLEPLNSRVIFHVRHPAELLVPLPRIEGASTEGFYFPPDRERPDYRVHSSTQRPTSAEFRAATGDIPPDIAARYLQLPALSERTLELARSWMSAGETPYDGALIVQQHLQQDFTYSLDQPSSGADDPVDHFLFDSQEGHCEFFATAMALMVRSQGTPARVVNGFYGGEYNPAGEYMIVRQRHAHSWVEVYFPGLGWQTFDPTPVGEAGGRAQLRFGALLRGWVDIGSVRWRRLVLEYDQSDQLDALDRGMQSLVRSDVRLPAIPIPSLAVENRGATTPAGFLALILATVALALVLGGLVQLIRSLRRAAAEIADVPPGDARRFVRRTRRWLRRTTRRLDLPPHAPPLEIAPAWDTDNDGHAAADVIHRFYAVRFGQHEASPEDLQALRRLH